MKLNLLPSQNLVKKLDNIKNSRLEQDKKELALIEKQLAKATAEYEKSLEIENIANDAMVMHKLGISVDDKNQNLKDSSRNLLRKVEELQTNRDLKNYHIQGNCYTDEDIIKLCMKYNLTINHSSKYMGGFDPHVADDITKFEKNYFPLEKTTRIIIAPEEMFSKTPKSIDPMLFVKSGNDWMLVSKWGKDMVFVPRMRKAGKILKAMYNLVGGFGIVVSVFTSIVASFIVNIIVNIILCGIFSTCDISKWLNTEYGFVGFIGLTLLSLICIALYAAWQVISFEKNRLKHSFANISRFYFEPDSDTYQVSNRDTWS